MHVAKAAVRPRLLRRFSSAPRVPAAANATLADLQLMLLEDQSMQLEAPSMRAAGKTLLMAQGPLAKQNPAAPQLYSVRTFVLDEAAQILRFSGSAGAGADAPREHYIPLRDIESLEQGEDARDFALHQAHGPPLSLRARSRAGALPLRKRPTRGADRVT